MAARWSACQSSGVADLAGRFKAIDTIRRRARFGKLSDELAENLPAENTEPSLLAGDELEDDRLRLIFTCCHSASPPDARAALTLREIGGLTTEEIAPRSLSPRRR